MAIKTKQEVLDGLKKFIPDEDTSDDTLTFLKDVADTLDAGADGAAWKQKAEDIEKEWKQKYKDGNHSIYCKYGQCDFLFHPSTSFPNLLSAAKSTAIITAITRAVKKLILVI